MGRVEIPALFSNLDNSGNVVVNYVYDAWGNNEVSGTNATLGALNPFRYRGYYYDTETGLYYLQTRYYDPEIGRFISQDSIEYADPTTINGLNLYAYCGNNPVMGYDPTGTWDWGKIFTSALKTILSIGAVIVAMCQGRWADLKSDWDKGCFNPFNQDPNIAFKCNVFSFYKGESVIKQSILPSSCQIAGTILLRPNQAYSEAINHELGHGIQEIFLGPENYILRVAIPSVITCAVTNNDYIYFSMPWERTADWFGGVNRTFKNGSVTKSYKNGSLGWAFAENILGVGLIPWYFIFGF